MHLINYWVQRFYLFIYITHIWIDPHFVFIDILTGKMENHLILEDIQCACVCLCCLFIRYILRGKKENWRGQNIQVAVWPIVLARQWAANQVIRSLRAWTPPEMDFQGEASLVSHKVNLKVTTEWQGQEKYYKALGTYLSEILLQFPPPSPSLCLPRERPRC